MHLGNMALTEGEPAIFDGIEFNTAFRWIDIQSELAFLLMDLDDRGASGAGNVVLNTWLHATGDYAGLPLLRFYQAYRAMVRAKVEAIRSTQPGLADDERAHHRGRCGDYVRLAARYTEPARRFLAVTRGVSGTGKSSLAERLARRTGALWLRSDVERKRLFGLEPLERAAAPPGHGIYTPEAGARTYAILADTAARVLQAGFPVIVDATFLRAGQRAAFHELAGHLGVPFRILWLHADPQTLRRRVRERARSGADPSDADERVLESQLAQLAPPLAEETPFVVELDSGRQPPDVLARQAADILMEAAGAEPGQD
jgi:predicted kinase